MHTDRRNGLIGRQPRRTADHIGRRTPMIVGSLVCGLLAFAYFYAISIKNVPLAFVLCVLMWDVVYQGYNAVYPSFYPELFPTRSRVWGDAHRGTVRLQRQRNLSPTSQRPRRGRSSTSERCTICKITSATCQRRLTFN